MEFFIKKNATLPILEVNLIKDGRLDYNYIKTNLSGNTIYFNMMDVDNDFYKVANGISIYDSSNYSIYYQFTKKNTNKTGRYYGEFTIINDQGTVILPLREKIFITVLDSFVDPDFCCT
jgi:hypothetical protein